MWQQIQKYKTKEKSSLTIFIDLRKLNKSRFKKVLISFIGSMLNNSNATVHNCLVHVSNCLTSSMRMSRKTSSKWLRNVI